MKTDIISITDSAAEHIKKLLKKDNHRAIGISINVESGGCSGSKYKFAYVYEKKTSYEELYIKEVNIFIHSSAVLKIFGTTLDYKNTILQSGFIFINPNEKGKCGCGQSVYL